jgi:hypothetical protein
MATRTKKQFDAQKAGAQAEARYQGTAAEVAVTPSKKELLILKMKADADNTTYEALVNDYVVHGSTAGGEEAVRDVLARMSAAQADLTDDLKRIVASAADVAVAASESGALDISVTMGTFHLGEYLAVAVEIHRVTHPRATSKWWGVVRAVFKGFDGRRAQSEHVVERTVEFYTDKVDRDRLYRVLYGATRMAFNANGHLLLKTSAL